MTRSLFRWLLSQRRTVLLFAALSAPAVALASVGKGSDSDRALLVSILAAVSWLSRRMTAVEKRMAAFEAKK